VLDEDLAPLSAFEEGDTVVVEQVRDDDPDVLAYLDRVGVVPDARFEITEIAPFDMVTLRPLDGSGSEGNRDGTSTPESADELGEGVSLPKEVAVTVSVRKAGPAKDEPALLD
jgi:Fe2+ transport system protein FeoA